MPYLKALTSIKQFQTLLVTIHQVEFDYYLHSFEVYRLSDGKYLGDIVPESFDDMLNIIEELEDGVCPIFSGWEDGQGNKCNIEGWI